MTFTALIAFINQYIITNGNNEITAAVLNPVLREIAQWARDTTGDLSDLTTDTQENLVAAINELNEALQNINNGGIQIYTGTDNPNDNPPPVFSTGDFYLQVDEDNNPVQLYQYNGATWIEPSDQDNIDVKKYFTYNLGDRPSDILAQINKIHISAFGTNFPYIVGEKESIWFIGTTPNETTPNIIKYKMFNKGKGSYGNIGTGSGTAGTALTIDDIELVYKDVATLSDIEDIPTTVVIDYDLLTGVDTPFEWLNEQSTPIEIQPQTDGYTLFKGTIDGEEKTFLWIGASGTYGEGELQSTDADFEPLSDEPVEPVIPTWEQTLEQNNQSSVAPIVFDTVTEEKTTYAGTGMIHQDGEIVSTVEWQGDTDTTKWVFPTKDGGVWYFASTADLTAQTLQLVLVNGNTATIPIQMQAPVMFGDSGSYFGQIDASAGEQIRIIGYTNPIYLVTDGGSNGVNLSTSLLTEERDISFPDASGKIALEENSIPITGTEIGAPVTGDIEVNESVAIKHTGEEYSSYFKLEDGGFGFQGINTLGYISYLTLGQDGTIVHTSDNPNSKGYTSNQDHTSNITELDYTQKKYVDESRIKTVSGTTYTLLEEDAGKVLHFTSDSAVTVTIPTGLPTNKRYEGVQMGDGQVSFVVSGTTVRVAASEVATTAEKYSVFGLDWIGAEEYLLYGKLELV